MASIDDLKEAIKLWEESIGYISNCFDDIEEYCFDVYQREEVDRIMSELPSDKEIPVEVLSELKRIDTRFIEITVDSELCIHDLSPKYYIDNSKVIRFMPLNSYDKEKYWYYYRWHPDDTTPRRYKTSLDLQRDGYGLDFENMSYDELVEAVKKNDSRAQ